MFEEALVVVPGFLRGTFRQTREIFGIADGFFAALGGLGEQGEVQALDRLAALKGEFGANAAFLFHALDFMAARAAIVAHPLLAFLLHLGIVHVGRVRVGRGLLLFLRQQIGGYVLRILDAEAQAGHHGHVLDLQFMPVVRALAVAQIENIGKLLLRVVFGADVFLLVRAIGTRTLARVMNPADEVIVVGLLAYAREVRGKSSALLVVAFADGVARETAASLE